MTHHPENSQFALHNRKEIVFILEDLAKSHTAINLDTPEGAGLVTSVLEVSSEGDYICLDISPDAKTNERIMRSQWMTFTTQTGVKVRWHATNLQMVTLSDGDAFSMEIPAVIERIQRREYFRQDTPMGSKALICKIPVEDKIIDALIEDMSVGGIGLAIKGTPHEIFSQGSMLEGCSIEFPGVGPVPFRLRVCGIYASTKAKSGDQMYHIGLEFVNISRGAEGIVQRQMVQLERDRIVLK